ncbi:MAG: MmoB/DmpM family protein [Porticoccaceae bacterium]
MSKVYIVLQDTDDARYIVAALEADNPAAGVDHQPAMIRVECEGELWLKRATVEENIGRDWDVRELQLSLISMAGNLDEDEDYFHLYWND